MNMIFKITASFFATDFRSNSSNLSLEFNADIFGDTDSQNNGLLTTAGNALPVEFGGDGVCPEMCLQVASLAGDNSGETQFAPTFSASNTKKVPEPSHIVGMLAAVGLLATFRIKNIA